MEKGGRREDRRRDGDGEEDGWRQRERYSM
jgi:hypothetical protein